MKIAIEAQRIFRPNKHGMDFVLLKQFGNYKKWNMKMNISFLSVPVKTSVWKVPITYISSS